MRSIRAEAKSFAEHFALMKSTTRRRIHVHIGLIWRKNPRARATLEIPSLRCLCLGYSAAMDGFLDVLTRNIVCNCTHNALLHQITVRRTPWGVCPWGNRR